jgi:hypothetical protein
MKATFQQSLALLLLLSSPGLAIEVPLPGLVGEYLEPPATRLVGVDLGGPLSGVEEVSLVLSGSINTSWAIADGDTIPWHAEFMVSFMESDPGFWIAATSWELSGEFNEVLTFTGIFGANWDFLLDGQAEMTAEFAPYAFVDTIEEIGPSPTGSISSAHLVVSEPVSTESTTFGEIKALFR